MALTSNCITLCLEDKPLSKEASDIYRADQSRDAAEAGVLV